MTKLNVLMMGKWFIEWFNTESDEWEIAIVPLWRAIVGDFLGQCRVLAPWRVTIKD